MCIKCSYRVSQALNFVELSKYNCTMKKINECALWPRKFLYFVFQKTADSTLEFRFFSPETTGNHNSFLQYVQEVVTHLI